MAKLVLVLRLIPLVCALCLIGCASRPRLEQIDQSASASPSPQGETPLSAYQTFGGITFGEPVAISRDFDGNLLVADRSPGQVIHLLLATDEAVEFDQPPIGSGFTPVDLKQTGFFVYVVDAIERTLLRFYKTG